MKQIILMIALVGCGKKESAQPSVSNSTTPLPFAETKANAEAGDAKSQSNLGEMYYFGQGVEQDFKKAVKWYQKAADQGYARAQFSLGWMYRQEIGVERNYVNAYAWYDITETNGFQNAKTNKAIVAERMTPAQIAKAEELVKEMVKKNPKLLNKK